MDIKSEVKQTFTGTLFGAALVAAFLTAVFTGGATCYAVARWANAKADEAEVRVEIMRREGLPPVERRRRRGRGKRN